MKQKIARIFRVTGIIFFVDLLRYRYMWLKNRKKNKKFLADNPGVALPGPYMIYETFRLDYQRYYEKGRETAEWVKDEVSPFMELAGRDILDWGCGPGRVVRHLPEVIGNGCRYYGSDYNADYIDWCSSHIPAVTFSKNGLNPPLPYGDKQFDLIYVLSIFTHLSERSHREWFDELYRLLMPGGILLLTTHGVITRQNLLPDEMKKFDSGELVVRGNVKEGHRMYTAYHPLTYMQQLIADKLTILKHKAGSRQSWGLEQDLWLLKKDEA